MLIISNQWNSIINGIRVREDRHIVAITAFIKLNDSSTFWLRWAVIIDQRTTFVVG